jgi:hypothetical protein
MRSGDGYGAPEERYSPDSVEGEFCEVDLPLYGVLKSSKRFALGLELLLYHRFGWPSGSYGVRVPMHHLPGAVFGSKDHRDPQIAGCDLLSSADLRVGTLYPQDAGKLVSHVPCYGLKIVDLPISEHGCPTLLGLSNRLPSTHGRAERVGEAHIVSVGEQLLHGLGVPFHELVARLLESFEYCVEISYSSHLELTSIVDSSTFPLGYSAGILRYLAECVEGKICELRGDGVLGRWL